MGNIVDHVASNKLEAFLVTIIAASGYFLYKQNVQNEKLRQILIQALKSKTQNIKQVEYALNQVYLKEHVEHYSIRNNATYPIYRIAITGGPCGGKSTSLRCVQEDLTKKGFRVFMVPEVPTLVVQAGGMILMSKFNIQERIKFQSLLIRFQMYAEDYFTRLAEMSKSPSIVLCDRGTVDPAAYVSKEQFQAIMDQEGWSLITLRDRRYDRVIFLSSAANGAEAFYTLQNNAARHEGIELARNLDKKTLQVWSGHPHLTICPNVNGQSFDQKIDRALRAVHQTVGLEMKYNRYEKYLIQKPQFPFDLNVETCNIQEIFLVNNDQKWSEDKLKKRGQNNSFTYQRKFRSKENTAGDYLQEIRKPLTSLQYVTLREQKADPNYRVVNRKRFTFVYHDLPYTIDVYDNLYGKPKTYILRFANLQGVQGKALIPDFIKVERQVRQDKSYSLRRISQIN